MRLTRGIPMCPEMVRALAAGRKTQTRRVKRGERCPYGEPGDLLYVREPLHAAVIGSRRLTLRDADNSICPGPWQWKRTTLGALYCPRWAARFVIRLDWARVARLKEITEADAQAEGLPSRHAFIGLWCQLHPDGDATWFDDPWVWVLSFTPYHLRGSKLYPIKAS